MVPEDEAWVTLAISDVEALQALALAKSLDQALTTRKTFILVSEQVSVEMRHLLFQTFNGVRCVSKEELSLMGLENANTDSVVVLWCWALQQFGKCVFLSPNFLATKNCDSIFQYDDFSAILNQGTEQFNTSLFVFKPNCKTFETLLKLAAIKGTGTDALNECFNVWHKIPSSCVFNPTQPDSESGNGNTKYSLILYGSLPWIPENEQHSQEWLQVYFQRILPLFDSQTIDSVREFIKRLVSLHQLPETSGGAIEIEENLQDYRGTIAVVGMSCRFPGANSPAEYWQLLSEGRNAVRTIPSDRPQLGGSETWGTEAGFLSCAIDEFDAKFFGISPREANLMDPQQRLLLEVTWESLENAGINPQTLKNSDTGVYVGMWQQDYERIILADAQKNTDANDASHFLHTFLGNKYSATASRVSFCLGLNGPALAVESGCSSSLNGVHLACESLHTGETSLALVSGVNLILVPVNPFSGRSDEEESVVLSKDFRCKTFDENANGFVRSEGCGVIVLKRFEDARRDGDNILAILRGTAVNNDGQGTSFGTPNEKAQEKVYRAAMKRANVAPEEVTFVETHGTGTIVGDPIEMYAVGQAYSANRAEPLLVGSVKTNIGHCEAAAGIASLIKVILCIQHEAIPPHLNLKTLNPRINLERIPAQIPMTLTSWTAKPKIAAVSSFSMSATNAHVIVQEPPRSRAIPNSTSNSMQMVTISAKSEEALKVLSNNFLEFLKANTKIPLSDIAYTANICRASLQHRIAIVANDTQQLFTRLEKLSFVMGKAATLKAKIGFLFTGQGSQYIGMAKGLPEVFPAFRQALNSCETLFQSHLNESLQNVIWNDDGLLNQTLYCQPAIFCIQYCLLQLWNSFGITPDFVLGHSIGEFAAAVCAGLLNLEDAMKLVVARSKLINELNVGNMLAIRAPEKTVKELIGQFMNSRKDTWIDIAAVNSPEEVVVSGQPEFIKQFEELCVNNGIKSVSIPATHAFHSREMDSVLQEFGKTAETVQIGELKCVYISGTLAKVMEPMEFGPNYWQRHLRDTVRFSEAISLVWAECKTLVEIGAQPILLGLAMANVEGSTGIFCPSLRRKDDATTAFYAAMSKLYVNGTELDWSSIYGIRQKLVNLPYYPFQRQKYWFVNEEGNEDELSPVLHPLLGRQFLSPLSELVFCQTLRIRELSYLDDHKVAEYVVVPMAGLLETFMAASREVLQGGSQNKFPITIENMMIEAALPLETRCKIQTLITSEEPNTKEDGATESSVKYKLSLNKKVANHYDKWKRHAQAVFAPSSKLPETKILNLEELKSTLKLKESLESSYQQIAEVGIQFGPKFQSLKSAWYDSEQLLTEIHLPNKSEDYICHPIVLDAIIQTYAFREYLLQSKEAKEVKKNLYLPISIKKFTWLSKTPSKIVFAHSNGKAANVTLYSDSGEPLGIMEGLELVQTTTSAIIRSIRAETVEVPQFMCDRWRPVTGKTCCRVEISKFNLPSVESEEFRATLEGVDDWKSDFIESMNTSLVYSLLSAFNECGWPWPAVGEVLEAEVWRKLLPSAVNSNVVKQYCIELVKTGFFEAVGAERYKVLRPLPSVLECDAVMMEKRKTRIRDKLPFDPEPETNFGEWYGKCLPQILQGKMTPLEFLFPEDTTAHGAMYYYTQSYLYNHQNVMIKIILSDIVRKFEATPSKDGILRILEVGAGTGSSAVPCIAALNELKIPFQYTFTDISPLFLNDAKKKLDLGPNVTYQTLNIELDPLTQGFAPEEYDIILGVQVIHATTSLMESLANIKKLLVQGGVILLGEAFNLLAIQSFLFGMLDGWWRFSDFRLEGDTTALATAEQWTNCLESLGFTDVVTDPGIMVGVVAGRKGTACVGQAETEGTLRKNWFLLNDDSELGQSLANRLEAYGRNVLVVAQGTAETSSPGLCVNPENLDDYANLFTNTDITLEGLLFLATKLDNENIIETQHRVSGSILHLLKAYDANSGKFKVRPKIVVATRGVYNIGDSEPGNPNGATAWGVLKVFRNEYPNMVITLIDLDTRPSALEAKQVFTQLWSTDDELFVAFRNDKQYALRLTYVDKPAVPVHLPHTDRFKFINPESGSFADIEIAPLPQKDLVEDFVELELKATALNFRDIFMILKPEGFDLPVNSLVTMESVGLDVSGIVRAVGPDVTKFKVGDEVLGITVHGGLGSHTLSNEKALMAIPKNMTFEEACTIPCAFMTAYVGLTGVAKITAEDRVLIHVATGGVGLASVQVARAAGSEIYATAGSRRKRAYLRAMGIKYVYHSRDTSYREGILRDTQGQGVTVVLNSLTGPDMKEATLDTCCQGGKFVEIAKINIWKSEEVQALRPDVKYTIVDLSNKEAAVKELGNPDLDLDKALQEHFQKIEKFVEAGTYRGLPCVVFPLTQLRDAFFYFQKARHIGKIVVSIPKTTMSGPGRFIHTHCIFNDKSTYLITGGLGGIGVEVTRWMLTLGARTIVLAGRALPKPSVTKLIDELNRCGSNVIVMQADVGEFEDCQRLLENIKNLNLPQLRGIMHAAGVLADNLLTNQNLKEFEYVLKPKVYGGWFLHSLTIDYQLEFFVMFSSLSGILGMVGQSNHASANRFLDSLAHYREAMGLPSTTINWGGWSDIGAAAHITSSVEVFSGMRAFTPAQGLAALNSIMSSRDTQVAVSEVTDWNLVKDIFRQGKYFDEMKSRKMEENKFDRFDHLIEDIKKATSTEDREEKIQIYMAAILKQTLNLPQTEVLDINQDFAEFGVDSLMAMEMKNRFHDLLGDKTLSISALQENRTIRSLSAHLARLIESEAIVLRPLPEVLQEDSVLPEEITSSETLPLRPSQFKSVLLTGATGHLGIHTLFETLKLVPHLTIHCIVRGTSDEEARERLVKTLTDYKLNSLNMENVIVTAGDLPKENLGLTEEVYSGLSEEVDAIIHCAAKTSHIENYQDGTKLDLRTQNVVGLLNILKFATAFRTKPILYASTLVAVTKVQDGILAEEYPDASETGESLTMGYPISKFVGEKLLAQAKDRGIPVTIIRFPGLFGSMETGYMPPGYNHLWSIILASVRVRMVPEFKDSNGIPIMAADSAARAAMTIFLNDEAEDGVYNFTVDSFVSQDVIQEGLNEHGISCEFVPFKEWRHAVFEEQNGNHLAPVASLYANEDSGESRIFKLHSLTGEAENIDISSFSPKVKRNYPEVSSCVQCASELIRCHLRAHFESATANGGGASS